PELLAVVLTGVFGEEEDFVMAPGKWSIRQIAAHLADTEIVMTHRFRQVIAEDSPTLIWTDQDAWANHLDYARGELRPVEGAAGDRLRARRQSHETRLHDARPVAGGRRDPHRIARPPDRRGPRSVQSRQRKEVNARSRQPWNFTTGMRWKKRY